MVGMILGSLVVLWPLLSLQYRFGLGQGHQAFQHSINLNTIQ
jgi:hypothetical protein